MWVRLAVLFALVSSRNAAGNHALALRGPRKVVGPTVVHLQQPDRGDWAQEVVEHPLNEHAQDATADAVGFEDEHEVYAGTCVALIFVIFFRRGRILALHPMGQGDIWRVHRQREDRIASSFLGRLWRCHDDGR